MRYIIKGGKKLQGKVTVSGNKNSVFPCIAASLLTKEEVVLENVPGNRDTEVIIRLIKKLGVAVNKDGSTLSIKAAQIRSSSLPQDLMTQLRGAVVLSGAILARFGKVSFHHPGGDIIGQRSIESHLEGFKALGVTLKKRDLKYSLQYLDRESDCTIFLQEASVSAVENLILASVLGKKTVTLKNCPGEPHVLDLCRLLNSMGARIEGYGSNTIIVTGVDQLFGTKFRLGIDCIEVGTYVVAAAITHGEVIIMGLDNTDLDPVLLPLGRFGINLKIDKGTVTVNQSNLKSISKLVTNIWPGFPTDLMSAAIVLATQSKGMTLCHDWMYESRMFFIDKLITMGAKITLADPHRVLVYGPDKLHGRLLETPDIRAGMALVLAALVARGRSIINQAELIERGYEDIVEKLRGLGADITRENV